MCIDPNLVMKFLQTIKENGNDSPEAIASDLLSAIQTTVEVDGLSEESASNLRSTLEVLIPLQGVIAADESNNDPTHMIELCAPYFELLRRVTLEAARHQDC